MESGIVFGIVLFFVLPIVVFHLWALIDILKTPASVWEAADQVPVVWVIVVLLLTLIGPILYVTIARSHLVAARSK